MFDVIGFSLWASLLTGWRNNPEPLKPVKKLAWEELALFSRPHSPTPMIEKIVPNYLQQLSTSGIAVSSQGVWLASDWWLLGQYQGKTPQSAASLTKIATSLAALEVYGANHQFDTLAKKTGAVNNGVLKGDLVIEGGGDPFFVWEEAIALANALHQSGIQQVNGDLIIAGDFFMNYQSDAETVAQLLAQAMNNNLWPQQVREQYEKMSPDIPRPHLQISGQAIVKKTAPELKQATTIVRHQSLPLKQILQQMNIYSNNQMADLIAQSVGGPKKVEEIAAKTAQVPPQEIQLINGSGLGIDNRISPRAVVKMLQAIQTKLDAKGETMGAIFPVTGIKDGTVRDRALPRGIAVKTGSLWNVSALAGTIPTERHGLVYFAIMNQNGSVETFRRQQDRFLQQLDAQWELIPFQNSSQVKLGDPKRNIVISASQSSKGQQN